MKSTIFQHGVRGLAIVMVTLLAVSCRDATAPEQRLRPAPPQRGMFCEQTDAEPMCPAESARMGGEGGWAAPIEAPADPAADFWPDVVYVEYRSKYTGEIMHAWASYSYSGLSTATYTFSGTSYSSRNGSTGSFRMTAGERAILKLFGSVTVDTWVEDTFHT